VSALAIDAAAAAPPALALRSLSVRVGEPVSVEGVTLAVARGEHAVLLGAAGAGHALLLRAALGLERCDAGRVERLGAMLAQDALFEDRAVEENVALGVRDGRSREALRRAVREALLLVGLKHVEHRRPGTLTAGERRRVALARAVAGGPELLVAEEPAHALDPVAAGAVYALLAQLRTRLGLTLLVAASDPRALEGADRAGFLNRGRLVAFETPDRLRVRADAALQQLLAGRPYGPIAP
jgi:D-methionine transport system ATP-binding protein